MDEIDDIIRRLLARRDSDAAEPSYPTQVEDVQLGNDAVRLITGLNAALLAAQSPN